MNKLNEGIIDRIAENIFKLIFKNELNKAEDFINKVSSKMTDEDRNRLQQRFKNVEDNTRTIRRAIEELEKIKRGK